MIASAVVMASEKLDFFIPFRDTLHQWSYNVAGADNRLFPQTAWPWAGNRPWWTGRAQATCESNCSRAVRVGTTRFCGRRIVTPRLRRQAKRSAFHYLPKAREIRAPQRRRGATERTTKNLPRWPRRYTRARRRVTVPVAEMLLDDIGINLGRKCTQSGCAQGDQLSAVSLCRGRKLAPPKTVVAKAKRRHHRVNWYGGQTRQVELVGGGGHW